MPSTVPPPCWLVVVAALAFHPLARAGPPDGESGPRDGFHTDVHLVRYSHEVRYDRFECDKDGQADAGEIVVLNVSVYNEGTEPAYGVVGRLDLVASAKELAIIDPVDGIEVVPPGDWAPLSFMFQLQTCPEHDHTQHTVFELTMWDRGGGEYVDEIDVGLHCADDEGHGGPSDAWGTSKGCATGGLGVPGFLVWAWLVALYRRRGA